MGARRWDRILGRYSGRPGSSPDAPESPSWETSRGVPHTIPPGCLGPSQGAAGETSPTPGIPRAFCWGSCPRLRITSAPQAPEKGRWPAYLILPPPRQGLVEPLVLLPD